MCTCKNNCVFLFIFLPDIFFVITHIMSAMFFYAIRNLPKNCCQNMLKVGKLSFWTEVETFDREINVEHKQILKRST